MTTAVATKTYKTLNWQAVKKIADAMDVNFYSWSNNNRFGGGGYGLILGYHDKTEVQIYGYERAYGNNEYTKEKVHNLAKQNLLLKLELWALKNNVNYELVKVTRNGDTTITGFRIVEGN